MHKATFTSIIVALGVAACASSGDPYQISDSTAARLAEFDRTGERERCLSTNSITQIDPLDERHLLVRVGAGKYYLNETTNRCSGADRLSTRLQYTLETSQLCRNEIIDVIDNSGFQVGSCSLNDFERLEKRPTN